MPIRYPAAILVGLRVGTLVAPIAVRLGDKAGGGDASTRADTRAEHPVESCEEFVWGMAGFWAIRAVAPVFKRTAPA